jgi:hypothetical protein
LSSLALNSLSTHTFESNYNIYLDININTPKYKKYKQNQRKLPKIFSCLDVFPTFLGVGVSMCNLSKKDASIELA